MRILTVLPRMDRMRTRIVAAGVFVAAGLFGLTMRPSADSAERVTFTSFRPGNWVVYLVDPSAGRAPRRLTSAQHLEYDGTVSPDGRWLVFCSERRGNPDLYSLDLVRGGEPHLLIDSDALEDQPAFSPDGRELAFVSSASGNADIYRIRFAPDSTLAMRDAENLTRNPGGDFRPAFSPDGRTLAFSSDRDLPVNAISPIIRLRDGDIYLLDLASRALTRVTATPGWDGSPAWSPDGTALAYYHSPPRTAANWRTTTAQIWTMKVDGTNARVLTPNEQVALSPEFLADGRILYTRKTTESRWEIVSTDKDGANSRVELSSATESYWKPARARSGGFIVHGTAASAASSPRGLSGSGPVIGDGPFVAHGAPFRTQLPDRGIDLYPLRYFTALQNPRKNLLLLTQPAGGTDLMVSRGDGSDRKSLYHYDDAQNTFAGLAWSRDGEWIAFTSGSALRPTGEADIFKMRADGSAVQNLTPGSPGNDGFPSFSKDGSRIVFRSRRGGQFDLYLMDSSGGNVRQLTNDSADDIYPVFSPAANQVAFLSDRDRPGTGLFDIYLLELNANDAPGRLTRITNNDVQEGHLTFSPDGRWLLFSSERGGINDEEPLVQAVLFAPQGYGDMYAYRLADSTTIRLTHNKWEEGVPSWEAAVPASGQADGADADLQQVIDAFLIAIRRADAKTLASMFTEDATLFYPSPPFPTHRVSGRAAIEAAWAAGFAALPPATGSAPPLRPIGLAVQRYGDTAIVTFELASRAPEVGRRTFVLERQNGSWKVRHLHASNRVE